MSDQPRDESTTPGLAALLDTDALLDRLGRREPTPEDLDDPVVASLALLAADIDLDPVPAVRTRRMAAALGIWPPVSDVARPIEARSAGPLAPPRSLPRTQLPHREVAAPEPSRALHLRLAPVAVAAGSALLLSMGAAAAVSGGESVNPADVVGYVVARISGDQPAPATPSGTKPASRRTVPSGTGIGTGPGIATGGSDAGSAPSPRSSSAIVGSGVPGASRAPAPSPAASSSSSPDPVGQPTGPVPSEGTEPSQTSPASSPTSDPSTESSGGSGAPSPSDQPSTASSTAAPSRDRSRTGPSRPGRNHGAPGAGVNPTGASIVSVASTAPSVPLPSPTSAN